MKVFCESFGGDRRQSQTRLEFPSLLLVPGSGLVCLAECFPALKRRAILKMSLRDKGMET